MTTFRPINTRSESDSSQAILLNKELGTNNGPLRNGWKPWTLKGPALLCLFITTLLLAAAIETLVQKSQRQGGGLALSESPDNLPSVVNLAYLYLPTIIAVVYSLAWSWVASDTKRLQPWWEMSKPGGASAKDSLLLDYPSTFFAWVPFRAASKRHWPVFLSGLIVLIVTCAITPLQGAILKIGRLTVGTDAPFLVVSRLPPVSRQSRRMDTTLLNTAFATRFLDHPLPSFTTQNYALLPARYQGGSKLTTYKDTNLTVATTKLSTDFECWPAKATWEGLRNFYEFDNNRGCRVKDIPIDDFSPYTMHYIGWQTNSWSEYGLNLAGLCPKDNMHQVLLVWGRRYTQTSYANISGEGPGEVEITASFCEPRYWKQRVQVSLSSNQSVLQTEHGDSIQPLGAVERLDSEFNKTAFEAFLSGGQPPDLSDGADGTNFLYRVSRDRHFMGIGLQQTLSNVIGFALGRDVKDLSVYKNPERLTKTFEAMHQVMFSLAVSRINTLEDNPDIEYATGLIDVSRYGVIVSRRFSIAVESLLLAVALLGVGLWWSCRRVENRLLSDPDSIKGVANLAKQSSALRTVLSRVAAEKDDGFRHALQKHHFYLQHVKDRGEVQIDMVDSPSALEIHHSHHCSRLYTPEIPVAMNPLSGLAFVLVLVAALSYLAYLKVIERRSQGLPLPMDSQLALEILENYIPIVFATLVESFLVLLNRLLATIQPFTELQRGHSSSSRSVDLKYTSLPPQLLLWKAAKARHMLLGILCLVTILGNALSVSLGGLFNELPLVQDEAVEISVLQVPTVTNNSLGSLLEAVHASPNGYQNHFTIAEVYWTTDSKLPPWLTEEYFFLPFDLDRMLDTAAESYTAKSHGVTVIPSCKPLAPTTLTRTSIDPVQFSDQPLQIASSTVDALPWMDCVNQDELADNIMNRTGTLAKNMYNPAKKCGWRYIRGWARSSSSADDDAVIRSAAVTGVKCQPKFTTAEFDLTVDSTGRVLHANRVSEFGPFSWGPGNSSHISSLEGIAFDYLEAIPMTEPWQNISWVGEDSLNHFLSIRNNSFTDATTPLPDPEKLVTEVEAVTKMLAGALFQQNPTIFEKAVNSTPPAQGTRRTTITKIFMADVAFIISMALLSLNVVTAIVIYVFGPTPFLPRFPDTIGSVLGYVAKSRLTEPDWETPTRTTSEYESHGAEKPSETTYSFGRYNDRDGNEHLGIDADPFVVRVDREGNPEWHAQGKAASWLAWFRGKTSRRRGSEDYIES
ncbi:hypothetical protein PG985_013814 [Apiospora marii]|uniref:uncharacterized protein n=1 Tax=Apiospora marii TaxID=335849 RepID=UPI00312EE7A3